MLLKNNGILPLDPRKPATIAVLGPNADPAVTGGGGSSLVQPYRPVSVLQGIRSLAGERTEGRACHGCAASAGNVYRNAPDGGPRGASPVPAPNTSTTSEGMKGEPALRAWTPASYLTQRQGSYADGQPVDFFSARWSAYFTPESSGTYTL